MNINPSAGISAAAFVAPQPPVAAPAPASAPSAPSAAPGTAAGTETRQPRPGHVPKSQMDSALKNALKRDPNAQFSIDRTSNAATFVSGNFAMDVKPGAAGQPVDAVAIEFLKQHGDVFGVANQSTQLRLVGATRDSLGFTHFKYQQYYNELPVFGQQMVVHTQDANVRSAGGRLTPNVKVAEITSAIKPTEAFSRVIASKHPTLASSSNWKLAEGDTLGVFTTDDGAPHLAYELNVSSATGPESWRYYLDAESGKVLDYWSTLETALNRETYDAKSGQSRPGKIVRREGDGPSADVVANAAHDNAKAVHDFYQQNFGRDSLDGRGMKLVSTVHFGDHYNNAFWDGRQMTYGDGDGERFTPFALALDVVGHEMAHGITEKTAGLQYRSQSGALNESWSDVFGNLIEKWDEKRTSPDKPERDPKWLVGELIFTPKVDGDGLRSMSAPGTGYDKDPQPAHMKDYKELSYDNGGVHINSGIPNKAAYEIATKIGTESLGKIWFRAQTQYLTPTSKFVDAANSTVQSAADLFGKDSAEVKAVRDSWASVGVEATKAPGIGA